MFGNQLHGTKENTVHVTLLFKLRSIMPQHSQTDIPKHWSQEKLKQDCPALLQTYPVLLTSTWVQSLNLLLFQRSSHFF